MCACMHVLRLNTWYRHWFCVQFIVFIIVKNFLQRLDKCVVAKEELETDLYSKVRNSLWMSLILWREIVGFSIFRHI